MRQFHSTPGKPDTQIALRLKRFKLKVQRGILNAIICRWMGLDTPSSSQQDPSQHLREIGHRTHDPPKPFVPCLR